MNKKFVIAECESAFYVVDKDVLIVYGQYVNQNFIEGVMANLMSAIGKKILQANESGILTEKTLLEFKLSLLAENI